MLYTTHHGEGGLGAPGCPRSDTCVRRKVAQRWPSNPSCEIDPHRFLVFSQIDPSSFDIRTRRPYFFAKKKPPSPPSPSQRAPFLPGFHPAASRQSPPSIPPLFRLHAVATPPLPGRCHRPSPCRLSAPPSARHRVRPPPRPRAQPRPFAFPPRRHCLKPKHHIESAYLDHR